MAVPSITLLPDPPLPTDPEAVFDAKAGASLTAQQLMVPQINTSLAWIGQQIASIGGYASTATDAANAASASATAADQSKTAAQAAASAAASSAGLPSLAGNARRPLAVLPNETGASWQTAIKALYIEPMIKQSSGGAVSLNVGTSGLFDITMTANTTLSITNLPTLSATEMLVVVIRLTNGATAYSVTFPAAWTWEIPGGLAISAPTAGKTVEVIVTFEGSTVVARQGSQT